MISPPMQYSNPYQKLYQNPEFDRNNMENNKNTSGIYAASAKNLPMQPMLEQNQSISNFKEAMKKANYLTSLFKEQGGNNVLNLDLSSNSNYGISNQNPPSNFATPRSISFLKQIQQNTPKVKSQNYPGKQMKTGSRNMPMDLGQNWDLTPVDYDDDDQDINSNGSFDIDNITTDIENFKNMQLMDKNPKEEEQKEKEYQKILISNQVLTDSNLDLKNKNKILEIELKNYKSNPIFAIQKSAYDESLLKFINGLKDNFMNNLKKNEDLMNEILTEQTELKNINEDYNTIQSQVNEAAVNFEDFNKENAELQALIEQKETDIKNLEENIKTINNVLHQGQLELEELKANEKNSIMILESLQKKKEDNDKLIDRLNLALANLNKKRESKKKLSHASINKNKLNDNMNENMNENQSDNLNDNMNENINDDSQKETLEDKQKKLQILQESLDEILENKRKLAEKISEDENLIQTKTEEEEKLKEVQIELGNNLDSVKKENEVLKKMNVEKENMIEKLKDNIHKLIDTNEDDEEQSQTNKILLSKRKELEEERLDKDINLAQKELKFKEQTAEVTEDRFIKLIQKKNENIKYLCDNIGKSPEINSNDEEYNYGSAEEEQMNQPDYQNINDQQLNEQYNYDNIHGDYINDNMGNQDINNIEEGEAEGEEGEDYEEANAMYQMNNEDGAQAYREQIYNSDSAGEEMQSDRPNEIQALEDQEEMENQGQENMNINPEDMKHFIGDGMEPDTGKDMQNEGEEGEEEGIPMHNEGEEGEEGNSVQYQGEEGEEEMQQFQGEEEMKSDGNEEGIEILHEEEKQNDGEGMMPKIDENEENENIIREKEEGEIGSSQKDSNGKMRNDNENIEGNNLYIHDLESL